nr:hypothetical protein CFP56_18392 [Quercus suber]
MDIDVDSTSLNHIDVIINKGKEDAWRFTGIYGHLESSRKNETWEMIRGLSRKFSLLWLCAGDFNEILKSHKKMGGAPRRESEMRAFRNMVDECELVNLWYTGLKFTWKGTRPCGTVLERLDRAFANSLWLELNLAIRVQHFRAHLPDHNPILIRPEGIVPHRNRPFRFKKLWLREERCEETVRVVWGNSTDPSSMPSVSDKIKKYGERLVEWSKHSVRNIRRQLEEKTKELIKAELAVASGAESNMVRVIQAEVNELLEKECLMWQQKARSLFLKSRDCNTCYFHQRASHRYKRNRILGLKNNNGA